MAACAPQLRRSCAINRNNAMPQSLRRGLLIRGVGATSSRLRGVDAEVSQGSSLLATLGFIAESLLDSCSLGSIKVRARCSEDGLTPIKSLAVIALLFICINGLVATGSGEDWPQFLGPHANGTSTE